jgi:hypothetical protein
MEFISKVQLHLFSKTHNLVSVKVIILILGLFTFGHIYSQPPPPCYANGNSGFGGAVGEGHILFTGEFSNPIIFGMSTSSNIMNDILVLYIDTGAPGRNIIDGTVDDNADDHRVAISNSNAYGNGSLITFPDGFEASYVITIDVNFGGLWSIPSTGSIGESELHFITSVNSTLTSSSQGFYQFDFNWENIGLNAPDEFRFVGLYVSNTACNSDEGYGEGLDTVAGCNDSITFTGYITLPGCSATLGNTVNVSNNINAYYFNNQLVIESIHGAATISVYDIHGRTIYKGQHQVQASVPILLELNKKELQFIVVESSTKKKVLKVIPN